MKKLKIINPKGLIISDEKKNEIKIKERKNIKININLEFLSDFYIIDNEMKNFKNKEKFIIFSKLIENVIKLDENNDQLRFHHLNNDELNKNNFNTDFNFYKIKFFGIKIFGFEKEAYFLDPTYSTIIRSHKNELFIFINKPYHYFNISETFSGVIKSRRNLCKRLNLKYIEYDFYEFLNFSNLTIDEFKITSENFNEYFQTINEYISAKNGVFLNKNNFH